MTAAGECGAPRRKLESPPCWVGCRCPAPTNTRRVVDDELDETLNHLPAVLIDGPKAVGKTATAEQRHVTRYQLDDAAQLQIIQAAPDRIMDDSRPVLIDEWHLHPDVWSTVKRAVDADRTPGQFILAGSAPSPEMGLHSGAARISTVRMRPLSLAERLTAPTTVSLAALLDNADYGITGERSLGTRLSTTFRSLRCPTHSATAGSRSRSATVRTLRGRPWFGASRSMLARTWLPSPATCAPGWTGRDTRRLHCRRWDHGRPSPSCPRRSIMSRGPGSASAFSASPSRGVTPTYFLLSDLSQWILLLPVGLLALWGTKVTN